VRNYACAAGTHNFEGEGVPPPPPVRILCLDFYVAGAIFPSMIKKKINKTTLDDLAGMVAKGFDSVEQRIDSVEQRMVTKDEFRSLESRVGKMDAKIDDIYDILARFEEGDILDLQKRVKILERTVKAMSKHIIG